MTKHPDKAVRLWLLTGLLAYLILPWYAIQDTAWYSVLPQILQGKVPLYVVGGWRDELRDQGLITYLNVPGTRVLIGDWLHCQNDDFALVQEAQRLEFERHRRRDAAH